MHMSNQGRPTVTLLVLAMNEIDGLREIMPRIDRANVFTNSGSWGNISCIVRRQTGSGERQNGQIVRCNAAWGG